MYRAKLSGDKFENEECWLIDDYLKKYWKVEENISKDETLLSEYVRHKLSNTE